MLEDGRAAIEDDGIAQKLAGLKADALAIRAMTLAHITESDRTGDPGPKGSLMKLIVTATHKALSETVAEMLGWDFLEFDGDVEETFCLDFAIALGLVCGRPKRCGCIACCCAELSRHQSPES